MTSYTGSIGNKVYCAECHKFLCWVDGDNFDWYNKLNNGLSFCSSTCIDEYDLQINSEGE